MPVYAHSHSRRHAGLWLLAFLGLYALGGALSGAGFRPAVAATGSAYVELAVSDLERAADGVSWLVARYDGRLIDNYRWAERDERQASLTALLPAGSFDRFYRDLPAVGVVRAERVTPATGNAALVDATVTVLLVAPYPAAAIRPSQPPPGETVRPIATWRPPSPLQAVWVIVRSFYRALLAVLWAAADALGPALIVLLTAVWLFWHSRQRAGKG